MRIISQSINLKFSDFMSFYDINNKFILSDVEIDLKDYNNLEKSNGNWIYRLDYILDLKKINDNEISGLKVKIKNLNNKELYATILYFGEDLSFNNLKRQENNITYNILSTNFNTNEEEKQEIIINNLLKKNNFNFSNLNNEIIGQNLDPAFLLNCYKTKNNILSTQISRSAQQRDKKEENQFLRVINTNKFHLKSLKKHFRKNLFDNIQNSFIEKLYSAIELKDSESELMKIGEKKTISSNFLLCNREIEIDKTLLSDEEEFYLEIEPEILKNKANNTNLIKNIKTISQKFLIKHKNQVENIKKYLINPSIKCLSNNNGNISLEILNNDLVERKMSVNYKFYSFNDKKLSKSNNLGIFSLKPNEKKIIFHNNSQNLFPNKVFYRVSLLNEGSLSQFSTIIVDGNKNTNNNKINIEPNNISILCKNEIEGIKIEINNIPNDIINFRLLREDLGISTYNNNKIKIIPYDNTHNDVNITNINKLIYLDKDVINNRKYKYYGMLSKRLGKDFKTVDNEFIERISVLESFKNNIVIEQKEFWTENNKGNLKFNISIQKTNNDFDFILNILKQTGYNEIYLNELQKQKTDLNSLFIFLVERIDLLTGRRVNLGFHTIGDFIDSSKNEKTAIDLDKSTSYKYIFKLCLKPTDTILKNTTISILNETTNKTTQVSSKKFKSHLTKRKGVIQSSRQLNNTNINDEILNSQIGIEIEKDFSINKNVCKIKDINIEENFNNEYCILHWNLNENDSKELDYFIVFVELNNNMIPISTIAYDNVSTTFSYVDHKFFNEVGNKKYFVCPIFNDFSIGEMSNYVSSNKEYNYNKNFIQTIIRE